MLVSGRLHRPDVDEYAPTKSHPNEPRQNLRYSKSWPLPTSVNAPVDSYSICRGGID